MRVMAIIEANETNLENMKQKFENGLILKEYRVIDDTHPGLNYPRLNLAHLLALRDYQRNMYVALTYNTESEQAYHCEIEDVAICGTYEDGFLDEESLVDYVFGFSGITIGEIHEGDLYETVCAELIQDGVVYLVDYVMNDGACEGDEQEHFDFNTLRLKEN